jgi:hypothetical protein
MVGQSRRRIYLALVLGVACAHKPPPTLQETIEADVSAYQARVREVVKDPSRAEKLVGLSGDFRQLVLERAAALKAYKTSIQTMNSNHGATRAEFDSLLNQQGPERLEFYRKVISLRAQMAEACTDSEWEDIKSARMQLLDDVLEVE